MSTFDLNIMADDAGKSFEGLSVELGNQLKGYVREVAHAAHAQIISDLQKRQTPNTKRAAYLNALKLSKIPDGYVISLQSGWASKLEDGFSSYDLKEILLKSKKLVGNGPRSGLPWVRTGKDGKKYATVPFERHPMSADPGSGDLDAQIKTFRTKNQKGRKQKLTRIFRDSSGSPIAGKAATMQPGETGNDILEGLTKYQQISEQGRVMSTYMNFRTVSEKSSGWIIPGSSGYGLFKKAEVYVKGQLEKIVKEVLP